MRNRYPVSCGVCRERVSAGEGVVHGSHVSGWTVTHDACPRGSTGRDHAQAYARRAVAPLRRSTSGADEIREALEALAFLVHTGWISREGRERIILASPALKSLDRLEVEEIVQTFTTCEGSRC